MKPRLLHTPLTPDVFSRQRVARKRIREEQRRRVRGQLRGTHRDWRGPTQTTIWGKRRSKDGQRGLKIVLTIIDWGKRDMTLQTPIRLWHTNLGTNHRQLY